MKWKNERAEKEGRGNDEKPNLAFMAHTGSGASRDEWVADSGASMHMSPNKVWMNNYEVMSEPIMVKLGNSETLQAIGFGSIRTTVGKLERVYHVPDLSTNLFSIGTATSKDLTVVHLKEAIVIMKDDFEVIRGRYINGISVLDLKVVKDEACAYTAATLPVWHKRLGHVSKDVIRRMIETKAVDGLDVRSENPADKCGDCALAKCKKSGHRSKTTPKADSPGMILHFDTVGPITPASLGRSKYFVLCRDEFSSFRMVECIELKSEAKEFVKRAISKTKIDTKNNVLCIKTDNGTEFVNQDLRQFLNVRGIIHSVSAPYTPQQNGFIERDIRTIVESARASLKEAKLTQEFWAESVHYTTYTLNRVINTRSGNQTPYELWHGTKPNLKNLHQFGEATVILDESRSGKYADKGKNVTFTGYTNG